MAGHASDCIYPTDPQGRFLEGSAAMVEFTSDEQSRFRQQFKEQPEKVYVILTQDTTACELRRMAKGRLSAIEVFPVTEELQ